VSSKPAATSMMMAVTARSDEIARGAYAISSVVPILIPLLYRIPRLADVAKGLKGIVLTFFLLFFSL
jgi:hypothetical protein